MRKFFILVLAAVLICSTAFAITDEQIMQLKDLADRMNDSYAETGTLFQDVYSDALNEEGVDRVKDGFEAYNQLEAESNGNTYCKDCGKYIEGTVSICPYCGQYID